MKDLRFVTLTLPNVEGKDLRETILRMIKIIQSIQDMFKKRKRHGLQSWQLVGIRKLECTFNLKSGLFHPHFHFLIQGKAAAKGLHDEWLRRVETASYKAQDVRKADKGSEKELFKYFSKMVTKIDGKYTTLVEPLDIIYQAMRGLRVFQPMGLKKDVSEEIDKLKSVKVEGIESAEEINLWQWHSETADWVNHETGEALTGHVPSKEAKELNENIYLNAQDAKNQIRPKIFESGLKEGLTTQYVPDFSEHRGRVLEGLDCSFQPWEKAFGLVVKKKHLHRHRRSIKQGLNTD